MPRQLSVAALPVVLVLAVVNLANASGSPGEQMPSQPTTPTVAVSTPGGGNGSDGGATGDGSGSASGDPCAQWTVVLSGVSMEMYLAGEAQNASISAAGDFVRRCHGHSVGSTISGIEEAIEASPSQTAALLVRVPANGNAEIMWVSDGTSAVPPPPTVDDLWPGAFDEAVSLIPLPDVSPLAPPVFQGTLVNAPLWLAVAPPGPVSARAEVGAVWAQVDVIFAGLRWDMGVPGTDDDVVECEGPGERWEGFAPTDDPWAVPECGWNYEQPSTPEHTGEGYWYDVTVTAEWAARLTGSDGRDVTLDPIEVPFEFDYVVYELQTVGSR